MMMAWCTVRWSWAVVGLTGIGWEWGAQVAAGADLEQRYQGQLEPADWEPAAVLGSGRVAAPCAGHVGSLVPQRFRARLGRRALRAGTVPESERIKVIASRLPVHDWPDRRVVITAVAGRLGPAGGQREAPGLPGQGL